MAEGVEEFFSQAQKPIGIAQLYRCFALSCAAL